MSLQNNRTIVDFTYKFGGNGTGASETVATIMFDTSGDNYTNPLAINEMCGNITIFNPMRDAKPDLTVEKPVDARAVKTVTATVMAANATAPSDVTLPFSYLTGSQNS